MTVTQFRWRPRSATIVAAALCISVGVLVWFGIQAVREWQRNAILLTEERVNDAVSTLATVLSRDMRGAENELLRSPELKIDTATPVDLDAVFASIFARYPYPESFFTWRGQPNASTLVFFNRVNRLPPWASKSPNRAYPVAFEHDHVVGDEIGARILDDSDNGVQRSVFEMRLSGVPYQVIAHVVYA